jgi:hypothetical protein
MGSPFPPTAASAPSLPVCLLALPSMPLLGDCFPCVTADLGKYALYSSALSRRVHWRTSLEPTEAEEQGRRVDMAAFINKQGGGTKSYLLWELV